jgi:hypothetical protein
MLLSPLLSGAAWWSSQVVEIPTTVLFASTVSDG